jgi:hypothetical protein
MTACDFIWQAKFPQVNGSTGLSGIPPPQFEVLSTRRNGVIDFFRRWNACGTNEQLSPPA